MLKDPAAGISSEDAVAAIGNRYDMILIAARRVRELKHGYKPKISPSYGSLVTAQVEIEQGLIGRDYLAKNREVQSKTRSGRTG